MEQQKVKVGRRSFKISDIAKELDIKKSVLRLWEKEFEFCFSGGDGELRGYSAQERKMFYTIKDLLHKQQLSLDDAKQHMIELFGTAERAKGKENDELVTAAASPVAVLSTTETFQPAEEAVTGECSQREDVIQEMQACQQEEKVEITMMQQEYDPKVATMAAILPAESNEASLALELQVVEQRVAIEQDVAPDPVLAITVQAEENVQVQMTAAIETLHVLEPVVVVETPNPEQDTQVSAPVKELTPLVVQAVTNDRAARFIVQCNDLKQQLLRFKKSLQKARF